MSAAEHNPSRRALLGVAVALPFVGRHPELVSGSSPPPPERVTSGIPDQVGDDGKCGDGGKWARALATYEAAAAELRAFERRTAGAPWEAQEAVEREMDERLDALEPALRRLLRTAAPNLRALAKKIELVVDQDIGSLNGGGACLAALKRDARRLARG